MELIDGCVLEPDALYIGDNGRLYCGRHCGCAGQMTGCDISGQELYRVQAADVEEAARQGWTMRCEQCGSAGDVLLPREDYNQLLEWLERIADGEEESRKQLAEALAGRLRNGGLAEAREADLWPAGLEMDEARLLMSLEFELGAK